MPKRTPKNGMVGITFAIQMETLTKIQNMEGNNLSKKLRTLIEKGLKYAETE
jgi:hypothetical protein